FTTTFENYKNTFGLYEYTTSLYINVDIIN
ncbi:MAG: hypothetical protein XD82_0490, partial [Methanoculleus marisnigri]